MPEFLHKFLLGLTTEEADELWDWLSKNHSAEKMQRVLEEVPN